MRIRLCHRNIHAVLLLTVSGLLLVSCHKDDPVIEGDAIRFVVSDDWKPMPDKTTKTTLFDEGALSTGSTFMVDAYVGGTSTKYISAELATYRTESADWRFDDDYFWPGWTDNPTRTLEASIPVPEWEPGKVYTYTLDLGDNDDIRFLVSVESWSADEDNGATVTFGADIRFRVVVTDWTDGGTTQVIV